MAAPIQLHSLTLDQAKAIAQAYSDAGINAVVKPDGPEAYLVEITDSETTTDPNADALGNLTLQGPMSTFGGPDDTGVRPDEGLALLQPSDLPQFPNLFLAAQPANTTGLARRLNPEAFYIACRWEYSDTPIDFLKSIKVKVSNPSNGQSADAQPVDWGPNVSTGRVADLSPGLARTLGLNTDYTCTVIIPKPAIQKATPPDAAGLPDITGLVTVSMVKSMFPATPAANITSNLPFVLSGLEQLALGDKPMVLMALATIRAETESFRPISEFQSRFNTKNTPFDLYEPGTHIGRALGNTRVGDGPLFKGRGYVQLTGRSNYTQIGSQIGQPLLTQPELANDPAVAGIILAQFLKNHEAAIRAALAANDLLKARKLVNGGTNGFDQFKDAYDRGLPVLPSSNSAV